MSTSKEIRTRAWNLLWRGRWFWRLVIAGLVLSVIVQLAVVSVQGVIAANGDMDWIAYLQCVEADQNPSVAAQVAVPELTPAFIRRASLATVWVLLAYFLCNGIQSLGRARVLIKCAADETADWFKAAFAGFHVPLSALGLSALMAVIYLVAFAALIVPGFVALYAFRYVFYILAEHPDWSPLRCVRESAALMKGNKWRAFRLDASHWRGFLAVVVLLLLSGRGSAIGQGFMSIQLLLLMVAICVLVQQLLTSWAIFYREIRPDPAERAFDEQTEDKEDE